MPKWLVLLLGLIIGAALGIGGYYIFQKYFQNEEPALSDTDKAVMEEQSKTADWTEFRNFKESWLIRYPAGFTVTDGTSAADKLDPQNSSCVKISNDNIEILIAGPLDENDPTACFATGLGTEWSNAPSEKINVGGHEYTATGMKTEAASAGYYKDIYRVDLLDDHRIQYGIDVNEKYGTITKADAKQQIEDILATYSAAE